MSGVDVVPEPRLGLEAGHPPFPDGEQAFHYEQGNVTFNWTVRGINGLLDCSDLVAKETQFNMQVSALELQKCACIYVKDAIRKADGDCPAGRAKLVTCLQAYKDVVEASESEDDSSDSGADDSGSDDSGSDTDSDSEDKSKKDNQSKKHKRKAADGVQNAKKKKRASSSSASSSSSSSSTAVFQSKDWLTTMAEEVCDSIWKKGPGSGDDMDKVVSDAVMVHRAAVEAALAKVVAKVGVILHKAAADAPRMLPDAAATAIMADISSENMTGPIIKQMFEKLSEMVKTRIQERLSRWAGFVTTQSSQ